MAGYELPVTAIVLIIFGLTLAGYSRTVSKKEVEDNRVNEILAHREEWGEEMCQWLVDNRFRITDPRTREIMNRYQDWGNELCQRLLRKRIGIRDTREMVKLALGAPTRVDEQLITERGGRFRWVYGKPKQRPTYIWFKNGYVTKIKQ
jgi:hypothetical protein